MDACFTLLNCPSPSFVAFTDFESFLPFKNLCSTSFQSSLRPTEAVFAMRLASKERSIERNQNTREDTCAPAQVLTYLISRGNMVYLHQNRYKTAVELFKLTVSTCQLSFVNEWVCYSRVLFMRAMNALCYALKNFLFNVIYISSNDVNGRSYACVLITQA